MTSHDLSFTIREIKTAHLAFPDTPGYWEQYRRQGEVANDTDPLWPGTNSNPVGKRFTPQWSKHP